MGYPLTNVKVETRQIQKEAEALLMDTLSQAFEPQRYFRRYVCRSHSFWGTHHICEDALCRE